MFRPAALVLLTLCIALCTALPVQAVPGGKIGVLKRGIYACEWPGDAAGADWRIRAPEADFTITSASRYEGTAGHGTYLRTGDKVQFTSGPQKGTRFVMKNETYLRRLGPDDETDGFRCVRQGPNNS
jgi:hypothetical protein